MPLGCDCYGGCWGDHSKNWPDINWTHERLEYLNSRRDLYGSYVVVNGSRLPVAYTTDTTRIRVETYKILFDVLQATESPPPKAQPEPTVIKPTEPVVDDDPNRLSLDNYQRMY